MPATPGAQDGVATTAIGSIAANSYHSVYPSNQGAKGTVVFELSNKPTSLIYPFNASTYTSAVNPASVFNFAVGEQKTGGVAHAVSCYIRFLQYDIDQSYNYVLQSPQLTR